MGTPRGVRSGSSEPEGSVPRGIDLQDDDRNFLVPNGDLFGDTERLRSHGARERRNEDPWDAPFREREAVDHQDVTVGVVEHRARGVADERVAAPAVPSKGHEDRVHVLALRALQDLPAHVHGRPYLGVDPDIQGRSGLVGGYHDVHGGTPEPGDLGERDGRYDVQDADLPVGIEDRAIRSGSSGPRPPADRSG